MKLYRISIKMYQGPDIFNGEWWTSRNKYYREYVAVDSENSHDKLLQEYTWLKYCLTDEHYNYCDDCNKNLLKQDKFCCSGLSDFELVPILNFEIGKIKVFIITDQSIIEYREKREKEWKDHLKQVEEERNRKRKLEEEYTEKSKQLKMEFEEKLKTDS